MEAGTAAIIRAYDGTLADAEGILAVERATFDESPYTAPQVQALLTGGVRQAWLAVEGRNVAGFVIAFLTHGLDRSWWEVDLLAVHPDHRGRGLGSRLVGAALGGGQAYVPRARAAIAVDNHASQRAFARNAFRAIPGPSTLLIHRPRGLAAGDGRLSGIDVRPARGLGEATGWLAALNQGSGAAPARSMHPAGAPEASGPGDIIPAGLSLLLAERSGRPAGLAELIEVRTLLYHGIWIESLPASSGRVRQALISRAVQGAAAAAMHEIGAIVPDDDWPLQHALLTAGFHSLGAFHWWQADLAQPSSVGGKAPQGHALWPQDPDPREQV